MFPDRAVETHEYLAGRQVGNQQAKEDMQDELFIPESTFDTSLFRCWRTEPRKVTAQVVMVDALRGDHGEEDIDDTLQRVDPQIGGLGFEVAGECGRLMGGRFWCIHTSKRLPLVIFGDPQTRSGCSGQGKLKLSSTEVTDDRSTAGPSLASCISSGGGCLGVSCRLLWDWGVDGPMSVALTSGNVRACECACGASCSTMHSSTGAWIGSVLRWTSSVFLHHGADPTLDPTPQIGVRPAASCISSSMVRASPWPSACLARTFTIQKQLEATIDAVPGVRNGRRGRPRRRPTRLYADKGYDFGRCRRALTHRRIVPRLA